MGGRKILYVITLRPLWFRASTPEQRVSTVLHELWHASERFDGTLHRGRMHDRLPRARYERRIRALRDRYLAQAPEEILAPFTYSGVARARMWLERPAAYRGGSSSARGRSADSAVASVLMRSIASVFGWFVLNFGDPLQDVLMGGGEKGVPGVER